MLRLTVSMSLVLALGVIAGGVVAAPPVVLAGDQPVDPVADWKAKWEKAHKDAANEYKKLADKYETKLEASSAYIRRFVLRYVPDDEDTRKFLGYAKDKQADGTMKWERVDTIRDKINELTDLDDPKMTKWNKDKAEVEKKVVNYFKGLARKATENGNAKDVTPEQKAEWTKMAAQAWDRLIEVADMSLDTSLAKDADEAHKALAHPKFEGKFCTPFKYRFIKARTERAKFGQKEASVAIKPVDAVECDGLFAKSGLVGGGARSAHFVINTTHGKDIAIRCAQSAEKALNDLIDVYGFPADLKERISFKYNLVKPGEEEFRKFLEKGADWKPADVQRLIDHHLGGTGVGGEYVTTTDGNQGADDLVANCLAASIMSRTAQAAARADLGSPSAEGAEEYLRFAMGYDVTTRLLNTKLTTWGAFGRYGEAVEARPGEDKWVELARRLVQTDDDIPLVKLYKQSLEKQDLKAPGQIKGWALVNFLFESDAEKAKKWIWHALAEGTPAACAAIFPNDPDSPDPERSMEKLDADYREWILKGW